MKITLFNPVNGVKDGPTELVVSGVASVEVKYRDLVRVTFLTEGLVNKAFAITGWPRWSYKVRALTHSEKFPRTPTTRGINGEERMWADWRVEE